MTALTVPNTVLRNPLFSFSFIYKCYSNDFVNTLVYLRELIILIVYPNVWFNIINTNFPNPWILFWLVASAAMAATDTASGKTKVQ